MKNCPACQVQLRPTARFCHHCGISVEDEARASTKVGLSPTRALSPLERGKASPTISVTKTSKFSPPPQPRGHKQATSLAQGKRSWEVETEPLPTDKNHLGLLPVGELLDNRRYLVLAVVREGSKENIYQVSDRQHRYCSKCTSTSAANENFCRHCKRPLTGELKYPTYFLRETLDEQIGQHYVELTSMGLFHPGLINLHDFFKSTFFDGIPHFYLLSDIKTARLGSIISKPLPEATVLQWGKQLAEALSYLHGQGMIHGDVRLEKIYLIDQKVKLDFLKSGQKITQQPKSPSQEVKELGDLLQQLIEPETLSQATKALFKPLNSPNHLFYSTAQAFAQAIDEVISRQNSPQTVGKSVTHLVGSMSDLGRQRKLNEDSMLKLEIEPTGQQAVPIGLYVVADGMGGHSAGDVASVLASQTVGYMIDTQLRQSGSYPANKVDYARLLKEACLAANRAVYEQGRQSHNDMGTTLVAVLLVGTYAYIANIGDSRVYLVNQHRIERLTTDHSLVERLVALKQISPQQARYHPQRHVIFRTVGDKPEVEVDLTEHRLTNGDYLILCSDGLHGMITDQEIQQTIIQSQHPQQAAEQLVNLANQVGGDDNITIIVIKIK